MHARRKVRRALLTNDANTFRELVNLVKKKAERPSEILAFQFKWSIATHVNLDFRAEPGEYASDRSAQLKPQKERESSQRRVVLRL